MTAVMDCCFTATSWQVSNSTSQLSVNQDQADSGRALLYTFNQQSAELFYKSERRMSGWRKEWKIITPIALEAPQRNENTTAIVVLGFLRKIKAPHEASTELRRRVETAVAEFHELQVQTHDVALELRTP